VAAGVSWALWPGPAKAPVPYVYEDDYVVDSKPVKADFLEVKVDAYHCGMIFITGTHAEHYAKGQICRVGVRLDNQQLVTANIDSRLQTIVLNTGAEIIPDDESMQIKRQEQVQQLGARNMIVLSYWFDIPADAYPTAVRIRPNQDTPPAEIKLPRHTWTRQ
jgi:hypothetical protein